MEPLYNQVSISFSICLSIIGPYTPYHITTIYYSSFHFLFHYAYINPYSQQPRLLSYRADPALVPMQSPFDEYVDMDVRQALASAPQRR